MRAFKRFAFAAAVAVYFVIFMGGLVRVSGAGMGCPDWPTCFGRWFPPTSVSQLPPDIDPSRFNFALAWIEYVNRLGGVTVGILIAVTALWALARFRRQLGIVIPAVLAAILVAYQGWQGGRLVAANLASYLVSIHMGLAFIIALLMTFVALKAHYADKNAVPGGIMAAGRRRPWLIALVILAVVQVFLGTQVRTALEEVSRRFPLLPEPDWLSRVGAIGPTHALLGLLVTAGTWLVGGMILARNRPNPPLVAQSTWTLMFLTALQVAIGALSMFTGAPDLLQLFHLLVSSLYAGVLLILLVALRYEGPTTGSGGVAPALRWALPMTALMVVIGVGVNLAADTSRGPLPVLGQVPEFTLTERSGESFGRGDMLGKIGIVNFFFTSCPGICPITNGHMSEIYHALEGSDKVVQVSISVDPARDSLPALRTYAESWDVHDNRWVFVRGPIDTVARLCEQGFMLPAENLPMSHTTKFILVDTKGRIRGYYTGTEEAAVQTLLEHLRRLAGETP